MKKENLHLAQALPFYKEKRKSCSVYTNCYTLIALTDHLLTTQPRVHTQHTNVYMDLINLTIHYRYVSITHSYRVQRVKLLNIHVYTVCMVPVTLQLPLHAVKT